MEARLRDLLNADPWRMAILHLLRALDLPDGWVAAGFVRDAVWDHLHGHAPSIPVGDIDIIWFDPARTDPVVVIEILSPSTAEHDHKVKLLEYQALAGVRQGLLIDPDSGAIRSVNRTDDGGWSDRWLRGDESIPIPYFGIAFSRADIGIGA